MQTEKAIIVHSSPMAPCSVCAGGCAGVIKSEYVKPFELVRG